MKRWFRRVLRRCGMHVPFADVVCPEHAKSIRFIDDGRIEVIDRRSLVFLGLPEPGDLRDDLPLAGDADSAPYVSPDAMELYRTSTRTGTQVCWMPREPLVRYALYAHQHGWISPGGAVDGAAFSEFRCDMKTGHARLSMITPARFEAAVVFKRPRWRRLTSERALVKYALAHLEQGEGDHPAIVEDGSRMEWNVAGPAVGDRYICVAFLQNGVQLWRDRLESQTLAARMRRLFRPLVSA
jgi:hypothetical protein